ncbi:MAG: sugar ABC transporter ATP-binding protein [Planctomycetota bacterium]|nr:sugar ABC transporter ATP-binding protein [Planctomycetota bacterium]
MADNTILQLRRITKTFPGVRALDQVDFDLRRGEVHALVGENGAGKSTLMHIVGGVCRPDSGEILVGGRPVRLRSAHDAALRGISVVHQELSLAPNLSVAENIFANRQPVRAWNLIDGDALESRSRELLRLFNLDLPPRTLVKHLSAAQQQVIEILKAVSYRPQVLVLDEPTSSLTAMDTELLFRNMERLKAEGTSIIYISHHLGEVFRVADRVTVLRDGRRVESLPAAGLTEDAIIRRMVGRTLGNIYGERDSEIGPEYFRVEGAAGGRFSGVSLALRRGEILGVAGLVGSGRTELARALFGAERLASGAVTLDGRPLRIRSPSQAIAAGIGYLTEDRKGQGLFLRMTVRDNCIAPCLSRFAGRLGMMDERLIGEFAEAARSRFGIITPSVRQTVRNLSGGNQQKVLLAMWMGTAPKVLIADEPTRGVDVGAKSEIYRLLRQLAADGVGIILISSDLLEVLGLADRILMMRQGRIAGEFSRHEATEENVIACASGVGQECPPG